MKCDGPGSAGVRTLHTSGSEACNGVGPKGREAISGGRHGDVRRVRTGRGLGVGRHGGGPRLKAGGGRVGEPKGVRKVRTIGLVGRECECRWLAMCSQGVSSAGYHNQIVSAVARTVVAVFLARKRHSG